VAKPRVFIGSSKANVKVADAIAAGLEDCATVTVWDEDVFRLNDEFLQRLLAVASHYDFAVMVWAPDDITDSQGLSQASPRDNVVFECGLFMGVLGLRHVFIVQDSAVSTKIPSDFAGITVAGYDGARIADEPAAAVRHACNQIEAAISNASLKGLEGQWRQRYTESADIAPQGVEEDIEVTIFADTVSLVRYSDSPKEAVFEARGRLAENRIRGDWHHKRDASLARGAFLLVLNTAGDVMYGYNGAYGPDGGAVFEAWVLAKKTGQSDATIAKRLAWGEQMLTSRTVGLPPAAMAAEIAQSAER
jgi:hypothetical protein